MGILPESCRNLARAAELAKGEPGHPREQPPAPEPADLGLAVRAVAIADGHLDDLEVLLRGAEEQVEVAERIEVAEEGAAVGDPPVVALEEHLGAAQRVLEPLLEDG